MTTDRVLPTPDEVFDGVAAVLVEALGVDLAAVAPDATLREGLGAESIDYLDIFFRIERRFGVSFSKVDFAIGIASDDWDAQVTESQLRQRLSAAELERVSQLFPEIDPSQITPDLTYADIGGLFTVSTLVNFVLRKLQAKSADGDSIR
jgi:acyl carrier protein